MLPTCTFEHPAFAKLGNVSFRAMEADRTPALVMPMGQATATVSLRALQHELGIANDSPDGRMLSHVARALDFVAELRPGDALTPEVLCGAASWAPDPQYREVAQARLHLQLTAVFDEASGAGAPEVGARWAAASPSRALRAARAPGMDICVRAATVELAAMLRLPDSAAAQLLLDEVAHELSFIEALRVRLLHRVERLCLQVEGLAHSVANNLSDLELISRVLRLGRIGLERMRARFNDVQEQTADVCAPLHALPERRAAIRLHRDWLYCSWRAWDGVLAAWEAASAAWSDATWPLLNRTYRFLAPRFMPMQEWLLTTRARGAAGPEYSRMVW